jgi:soluble lytic murein transglycosylase-like protein
MNFAPKILVLKTVALLLTITPCLITPGLAMADIYIDLSSDDEISISNSEQSSTFAIKIEEPVEESQQAAVIIFNGASKINDSSKINQNQLPYHNEVLLAANETALEPALIHAIIATESKHNTRAKSPKGAVGLMQLMPATARRFNVQDKHNPKQNILAGSKYLRELLTQFNGDLSLSLAAYNAGPGAVQKYSNRIPPYKETMRYVPKVLKYYKKYS